MWLLLTILSVVALIGLSWIFRKGMDSTLWHEATLFVSKDGFLIDYEDLTAINLETKTN